MQPAPQPIRVAIGLSLLSSVFTGVVVFAPLRSDACDREHAAPAATADAAAEVAALQRELQHLRSRLDGLEDAASGDNVRVATVTADARSDAAAAPAADDASNGGATPARFDLRSVMLRRFPALPPAERVRAIAQLRDLARWGDAQARLLLLQGLADTDPAVRAEALQALAELADPELATRMPEFVANTDRDVRAAAARVLGSMSGETAGPLLLGLLGDAEAAVVTAALHSIHELDGKWAVPQVRNLLAATDLDVAAHAAATLRRLGEPDPSPAVTGRVMEQFANGNVADRVRGVKRLRRLHAAAELHRIVTSDPSPTVRFEAQRALASLED